MAGNWVSQGGNGKRKCVVWAQWLSLETIHVRKRCSSVATQTVTCRIICHQGRTRPVFKDSWFHLLDRGVPGPRTNTTASSSPFNLFQLFYSFSFIIIIFGLYVCTQEVTSGRGWGHILSQAASFPVIVLRPTWGPIHLMSHKATRTKERGHPRLTSCSRSSYSIGNHTVYGDWQEDSGVRG